MKNKKSKTWELNAGTGMSLGIVVGAVIALLVNLITGDSAIWSWAIPVGLACGLAVGAGQSNNKGTKSTKEKSS